MKSNFNRKLISNKSFLIAAMITVFVLATVLTVNPGLARKSSTPDGNQIAIKVDNEKITKEEFQRAVKQQVQMMQKRLSRGKRKVKPKRAMIRKRVKKQVREGMIDQLVLKSHAKRSNVSVPESVVQKQWNQVVKRAGGEKVVKRKLKQSDMTKEEFLKQIREKELVKRFIQKKTPSVRVTEKEIRNFYEKSKRLKKIPFKKAKRFLKRRLKKQKERKHRQELVRKLKKKSNIEVNV